MTIAEHALELIVEHQVIGLGSGRAATAFVAALGERVQAGLRIRGVPTSKSTEELARASGIPLTTLAEVHELDITVDGADEVSPCLDLIKGYGGALVREKIVAASAKKFVILVGPEKKVQTIGQRGRLPVEVVPFGVEFVRAELRRSGLESSLRYVDGDLFETDNHNYILDVAVAATLEPISLENRLRSIPGVVGTGLFIGMADTVLIQHPDRIEVLQRRRDD